MSIVFMNDAVSLLWLREQYCPSAPPFQSAVIEGREDWPDRIRCFANRTPKIDDDPIYEMTAEQITLHMEVH